MINYRGLTIYQNRELIFGWGLTQLDSCGDQQGLTVYQTLRVICRQVANSTGLAGRKAGGIILNSSGYSQRTHISHGFHHLL